MKDVNILTSNGVDVQQSVDLLGDMEMYDETLSDFLDMHEEKLQKLEKFRAEGDMPNYAIEVHALKSDARYLGFMTLGDMSYESEMKSKAGDVDFVNQNHPKIMQEAKRVINLAQAYLGRPQTEVIPTSATAPQAAEPAPAAPTMQSAPVNPVETPVAPQAPVMQSAPVNPVGTPVTPQAPAMEQPMQAPVNPVPQAPMMQSAPVTPVSTPGMPNEQPLMPAEQPRPQAPEPVIQSSSSDTIQFFPSNNDIMGQALYTSNQNLQQQPASGVNPVKQGIIVVIDDSNLVANFVKKIFSDKYEVMVANDGAKGLEIVNDPNIRPKIKACLVDLYMPNIDGFQVLDNFNQNGVFVKTPVAVISGAEDVESIEKAKSYPIIDVLAKPFTDRDVKMVVEKCLAAYF